MKSNTFKEIIIEIFPIASMLIFMTIILLALIGLLNQSIVIDKNTTSTYTLIGTTKMYSDVSSTLIIEDNNGKLWSFTSYKLPMSIPLDTVCAMIINDNETENFDDDYIIDVIFKNG